MITSIRCSVVCTHTLLALALSAGPMVSAHAEKADRFKKLEVESDQPGKLDLLKQQVIFNGNVVVTKGSLVIHAARIEVRESGGHQVVMASGLNNAPATFRQKRDGVEEFIEGEAQQLEYDSKSDTARFINKAHVRRLRGTEIADEASGALIIYDHSAEVFTVSGGAAAVTPTNPKGRVRVVLAPRENRASEPASLPASSPAP